MSYLQNMNLTLDSQNSVLGQRSAYLFFLFVRNSKLTKQVENIMFDIIRFLIRSKFFFRLDYFDRFKLSDDTDLVHDNNDYFSKNTIYLKDINININPISGRRIAVDVYDFTKFHKENINGLGLKNIKYVRLDLVEEIELEIGGSRVDRIYNNCFSVLQQMYGINDKNIIPFGCIVKNYWFPFLMNTIRLIFRFKSFNNDEKIDYPVVYELYQISDIKYLNQNDSNHSLKFSTLNTRHYCFTNLSYRCSKYRFGFNNLVTDILISLTPDIQIKKCQIILCDRLSDTIKQEFTWENNNSSTLMMNKIDIFYVFSFVPSSESRWSQNYGLNCCNMTMNINIDLQEPIIAHDLDVFTISKTNCTISRGGFRLE